MLFDRIPIYIPTAPTAPTAPIVSIGDYVHFNESGKTGEGTIVGLSSFESFSVRIEKRITPGSWGNSDASGCCTNSPKSQYWNVDFSNATKIARISTKSSRRKLVLSRLSLE